MAQDGPKPLSPGSVKSKPLLANHDTIPLESSLRTDPIHPSLPDIKISNGISANDDTAPVPATTLNPLTLKPLTVEELTHYNFETLHAQYSTPEAARKAREDAAAELRSRMLENERRSKEVEREMEEKEKTREIERKVYMKKLGKDGG